MGKSIYKKAQKMQEKMAKKYAEKPKTTNEILGLKNIKDYNKKNIAEQFGYNLNQAWYFEKWYEKLILVGLCLLGMWKIIGFF